MAKKLLKLSTLLGVVLVIFLLAGCPLTQPKVALNVSTEGQGDVNLAPEEGPFAKGTTVTLTAVPEEGWEFIEWSGDLSGSNNPETLVMDEDKSVTAHFEEKPPVPTITFVSVPEGICGGDEFEVVVEVLNADDVNFILQRGTETPIEPEEVEQDGDLYTITFKTPETTEDQIYELIVEASNEDEETIDSKSIIIYETDKTPPQISTMSFLNDLECDATSAVLQFGVCDETAIDVSSLRFVVSHGTFEVTVSPDVSEYCLTNGEVEWEFGDVDCEEVEITMYVSDKCGNEASRTRTVEIDNMDPEIKFIQNKGDCDEEVQLVKWEVTENCLESFDATTCCEAVDVEFGEWEEDDSGDRIVTTIPATLTFNNIEDCTDFDFDVTAEDECGNISEDEFTVDKDLRDPRIRVYGFLDDEYFTPHLSTLVSALLGIFDLELGEDATPVNINDPWVEDEVENGEDFDVGPECDAGKAYFVWIAEDDCLDETLIEYDNVCRTGEKVESFTAIPGVVVGYQRIDFDCVTDCEEIEGDLTVWDECRNDATGEATIVIDNLEPRVDWDVEEPDCGDTGTTISWDATDGSEKVHVAIEISDGSINGMEPWFGYGTNAYYSDESATEVTWQFGDIDCEDITATITVFDDCDDCWGYCGPVGETNEFKVLDNGLSTCGGNYFQDSKTITVDNVPPEVEDLDSVLVGEGETDCGFTEAFFSFAATENCVEDVWVEYEIIGIDALCEDASETGVWNTFETTVSTDSVRDYTTFAGTMTLPEYGGATITAIAYVKDGCHTATVTLLDELYFDNVAPDIDYYTDPVDLDCVKQGDSIFLHAEAFDCNLVDYDATITWESTETYDATDYTLVEELDLSESSTHVTYDATLTIDATDIEETFTVTMVATDVCGNTTTESFDFRVDSIAPDLDNFAFNAKTNKLWFWLTEDIWPAGDEVLLTIYVWTGDTDPSEFEPEEGNPVVIGNWNKIVQGTTDDFYDNEEAIYYNKDLEHGWMEDILVANLDHDAFNYDLEQGVFYAFVLDNVKDECGNIPDNPLYGFDDARHFSPEF